MESKHTNMPWEAIKTNNGYDILSTTNKGFVEGWIANTMAAGKSAEESEANAKLIAAAPEMLETLREIVNQWDKDIMAASYMMEVRELISKLT